MQQMQLQNPSHGVSQTIINHVHLISCHPFPLISHQLGMEQAYRYLSEAPQIVKQLRPMAWNYIQCPQDGTLWLEWIAPDRASDRFPSDGYVWSDPEQTYRHNFGGYEIEAVTNTIGYRPGFDSMATRSRTRYHFISKNPNHNAAPPDPQLWLVHYHPTDPHRQLPTAQIPPNPQYQQILRERAWMESQGRIEEKKFMLHDRAFWPVVDLSNTRNPRQQQWPPQPPGGRLPPYPQPPPRKKMRSDDPVMMPGSSEGGQEHSVEDEESTQFGDYFDHLTQRDISMARYLQHHWWMEEVFSSPYASHQIVPADLGLGLMGELKGLTDGILEPPSMDFLERAEKPQKAKEAQPFTNLKQDQLDEFNKRVEKHLEGGQAEIERMKTDHAAKMQEWKKTKTLLQAEKRLRYATWEDNDSAFFAYDLEEPVTNGHTENGAGKEHVESIVKEVENLLGVKIVAHKEADMIEKGGLENVEDEEERHHDDQIMQGSNDYVKRQPRPPAEPTMYPIPTGRNQAQEKQVRARQTDAQQPSTQARPLTAETSVENLLNEDSIMGGMEDVGVDFGDSNAPEVSLATAVSTLAELLPTSTTAQLPHVTAGDSMFNDSTFDDLTNMVGDEGGDDGLIDFEGGVGMEDGAFGDALHGMEGSEGQPDSGGAGGS